MESYKKPSTKGGFFKEKWTTCFLFPDQLLGEADASPWDDHQVGGRGEGGDIQGFLCTHIPQGEGFYEPVDIVDSNAFQWKILWVADVYHRF